MKPLANLKEKDNILLVSTKELSETMGLSPRRIQQLAKDNIMVRVAHGKYDLPASIQTYIEMIKEESQSDGEIDYKTERALLTRAQRKRAEMELKIIEGKLHRSEDVESVMNDMLTSFRAQMLVIPGKIAPSILGVTELEDIKKEIKDTIYEALQELSEYDPNMFYSEEVDNVEDKSEEKSNRNNKKTKKNGREQNKT